MNAQFVCSRIVIHQGWQDALLLVRHQRALDHVSEVTGLFHVHREAVAVREVDGQRQAAVFFLVGGFLVGYFRLLDHPGQRRHDHFLGIDLLYSVTSERNDGC